MPRVSLEGDVFTSLAVFRDLPVFVLVVTAAVVVSVFDENGVSGLDLTDGVSKTRPRSTFTQTVVPIVARIDIDVVGATGSASKVVGHGSFTKGVR